MHTCCQQAQQGVFIQQLCQRNQANKEIHSLLLQNPLQTYVDVVTPLTYHHAKKKAYF